MGAGSDFETAPGDRKEAVMAVIRDGKIGGPLALVADGLVKLLETTSDGDYEGIMNVLNIALSMAVVTGAKTKDEADERVALLTKALQNMVDDNYQREKDRLI